MAATCSEGFAICFLLGQHGSCSTTQQPGELSENMLQGTDCMSLENLSKWDSLEPHKTWSSVPLNSPEEVLPLQLVELGDDVVEGALYLGDDDVLDGVDAPVRRLDHLVQRHE